MFVSYAREDEQFVQRLCGALAERNHQAWIDQIDLHPFDPDWAVSVCSAIEACATFLMVMSPESVASEACAVELAHAVAHNKRLAPILHRDVGAAAWKETLPALGKPNWFLLRDSDDFDRSMHRLIDAIEADLDWVDIHSRLLVRAKDWERKGAGVLGLAELREAERWLAGAGDKQPAPLPLHSAFIRASRERTDRDIASRLLTLAEREARGPARNFVTSILLAIESYRLVPSTGAQLALRRGLLLPRLVKVLHQPARSKSHWARIKISPDGRFVAIREKRTLDVLEVSTGDRVCSLELASAVDEMCFSPSGRQLATWCNVKELTEDDPFERGPLEVFRIPEGHRVAQAPQYKIMAFAFSPDERYLLAGGYGRSASIIDLESGDVKPLDHGAAVFALAFHPDGRMLAAAAGDYLWIWSFPTLKLQNRLKKPSLVDILCFSPNGYYLLAAEQSGIGYLHLWTVERRWWGRWQLRPVPKLTLPAKITAIAYHTVSWADFAVATADGTVHVCWAGHSGDRKFRIEETYRNSHEEKVTSLAFRVFDKSQTQIPGLATASRDGTVREWVGTNEIARAVHTSGVESVQYSSDGRHLVSYATDGGVYAWESNWLDEYQASRGAGRDVKRKDETLPWLVDRCELEGEALLDELCRRLPRNLTIDEWRSAFGDEPYRLTCPNLPPETEQ